MVTITIQELTKRFGNSVVLSDVSAQVQAGEMYFLVGPSGCGKTTLLRHIAGFYKPDSGKVWFDETDVTRLPAHKRGTGMMFQSYALWPHLNVAQNVAFGLEERKRPRSEIEQRVQQALEQVKLGGLGARKIQQLSGGQQQRVALARALVVRPKCLLLDEPLSNLDAKLRLEMRGEIRSICKEHGLTAIYVTHDRDEALSMADRIAVMEAGQIVQEGTPTDIYRNPSTRMVAEFMGETNFIPGRVSRAASDAGSYEIQTSIGSFIGRPYDSTWHLSPGQQVTLSIRPESLSFKSSPSRTNQFRGVIIDTLYLGALVQYRMRINDEFELKLCEVNPQEIRSPSNTPLTATNAGEDVVILPP